MDWLVLVHWIRLSSALNITELFWKARNGTTRSGPIQNTTTHVRRKQAWRRTSHRRTPRSHPGKLGMIPHDRDLHGLVDTCPQETTHLAWRCTSRRRTPQSRFAKLRMTLHDTNPYGLVSVHPQGTCRSPEELTIIKGPCTTNHSFSSIKANPPTNEESFAYSTHSYYFTRFELKLRSDWIMKSFSRPWLKCRD